MRYRSVTETGTRPAIDCRDHHPHAMSKPRSPGRPRSPHMDQAILEAALQLLREGGYTALSVAGVAARAKTSRPAIYRRYRDRADLAAAALASVGEVTAPIDTGDTRSDLIELVRRFADAIDSIGVPTVASLLVERQHPELIASFRERVVRPRRRLMRTLLKRGQTRGEIREDLNVELTIDALIGPLFSREIAGLHRSRRWAEQIVDLVWTGIANLNKPA